jgi:hypothetical protein
MGVELVIVCVALLAAILHVVLGIYRKDGALSPYLNRDLRSERRGTRKQGQDRAQVARQPGWYAVMSAVRWLGLAGSAIVIIVALFVLDGGASWVVGAVGVLAFVILNPALALNCPHCGRWVAMFSTTCGHCGRTIRG